MNLRRVAISISMGVLTTIGFAWHDAYRAYRGGFWNLPDLELIENPESVKKIASRCPTAARDGAIAIIAWRTKPTDRLREQVRFEHKVSRASGFIDVSREYFGWPMHSLSFSSVHGAWSFKPFGTEEESRFMKRGDSARAALGIRGPFQVSLPWFLLELPQDRVAFPRYPVLPGFVINTGLFASAAWILLLVPAGIHLLWRFIGHRKGHCRRCNYPVAGLMRCPECGTDVTSNLNPQSTTGKPLDATP